MLSAAGVGVKVLAKGGWIFIFTEMLRLFSCICLALITLPALAEEVKHTHMAYGDSEPAAFSFLLEKEDFQSLLKQLPSASVEIDRAAITKRIVQRLNRFEVVLSDGQTIESLAEQLLEEIALPILEPRVEKLNELLNAGATKDKVSAGFLAFTGLAKSMASRSHSAISTISAMGRYRYISPDIEEGKWEWWDDRAEEWRPHGWPIRAVVSGTTKINGHLNGAIEEEIEFDLAPYGIKQSFTLDFDCDGKVELEQTYASRYVRKAGQSTNSGPVATVSIRPLTTLTATKTMRLSSGFRMVDTGELWFSKTVKETFEYPAVLEFKVTAEQD